MAKRRPDPPSDSSPDPDDSGRDPVKFPFGESSDSEDGLDALAGRDKVKFPFGETGDDQVGWSDSDLDALIDSDSDLDFIAEDPELAALAASRPGSKGNLPTLPPDSLPEDDASLEGIASDLGTTDSDLGRASLSDMGPIGPSGPLVIVDDEPDVSTRFQASVVDDSARLAGSKSMRRPPPRPKGTPARKPPEQEKGKKKKKKPPPPPEPVSEWEEEPLDEEPPVPTPSRRASRRDSGRTSRPGRTSARTPAAAPPRGGKGPVLIAALLGLVATATVGWVQEERRRRDLRLLAEAHQAELAALREELERKLEAAAQAAKDALAQAVAAETRRQSAIQAGLERQLAEARSRLDEVQRAAEEAEAQALRRQAAAVEAELARARVELRGELREELGEELRAAQAEEAARAAAAAREEGAAAERAKARTELEAERRRHEEELRQLRRELEEARDAVPEPTASPTAGGPTGPTPPGSPAQPRGKDDWDDLFGGPPKPGGDKPAGGGGDDWDALFQEGEGGGQQAADAGEEAEEEEHWLFRAWGWLRENVHGELGYKNLTHFSTGPNHDLRKTRHELRAKIGISRWLWQSDSTPLGFRMVAIADIREDDAGYAVGPPRDWVDDERRRPVVWPEEAYAAASYDWIELRLGWQQYTWGTGDLFNPTDNINPRDYSDLFDTRKIAVPAATLRLDTTGFGLEVAAVPIFTPARIPLYGKRFDNLSKSPIPVLAPDEPPRDISSAQWGARGVIRAGGWDVGLSGYTGFQDVPAGQLAIQSFFPLVGQVFTHYDKVHVAGLDFATTLGFLGLEGSLGDTLAGIQVHGEAAHFWHEGERTDDFCQYVLGLNYQFVDLIAEHDLTVILEYAGDFTTHRAQGSLPGVTLVRVFKSAILARLIYDVDTRLSFALGGGLILYGEENLYLQPLATWNPIDELEFSLGADLFFGPEGTFFGQYDRDDRVFFSAKLLF